MFQENYKALCKLSYYYVEDMDEARDIVQDIFVSLLDKNDLHHVKNTNAYLKKAVSNLSIKRARQRGNTMFIENLSLLQEEGNDHKENEIIANETAWLLQKELEKLPDACRKVFELCVIEGLKYNETAETLGISVNTVKTQIKKAYRILRESLSDSHFLLLFIRKLQH